MELRSHKEEFSKHFFSLIFESATFGDLRGHTSETDKKLWICFERRQYKQRELAVDIIKLNFPAESDYIVRNISLSTNLISG